MKVSNYKKLLKYSRLINDDSYKTKEYLGNKESN